MHSVSKGYLAENIAEDIYGYNKLVKFVIA